MQFLLPILSQAGEKAIELGKNVVTGEFKPSVQVTRGIDEACNKKVDCSATGFPGGSPSNPIGGPVGCCDNKCQFLREDYIGVKWCPSVAKGGLFSPAGTGKMTLEEIAYQNKLDKLVDTYDSYNDPYGWYEEDDVQEWSSAPYEDRRDFILARMSAAAEDKKEPIEEVKVPEVLQSALSSVNKPEDIANKIVDFKNLISNIWKK